MQCYNKQAIEKYHVFVPIALIATKSLGLEILLKNGRENRYILDVSKQIEEYPKFTAYEILVNSTLIMTP